jgi:hypothetical protein
VGVWQELQNVSSEAKASIAIPAALGALLWAISEVRHFVQHNGDRKRIAQLDADRLRDRRAIVELVRPEGTVDGAAVTLGRVDHEGAKRGQSFHTAIRNAGPYLADGVESTAVLGPWAALVLDPPRRLPPFGEPRPLDIRVSIEAVTYADVMAAVDAGAPLRIRVAFQDGTPDPQPFEQCFAFRQEEPSTGGMNRVSRIVPCLPSSA